MRADFLAPLPALLAVLVVMLMAMYVCGLQDDTLELEQQQYCRMVHEFQLSGGETGWPDYDNAYATSCNADGSVKEAQ